MPERRTPVPKHNKCWHSRHNLHSIWKVQTLHLRRLWGWGSRTKETLQRLHGSGRNDDSTWYHTSASMEGSICSGGLASSHSRISTPYKTSCTSGGTAWLALSLPKARLSSEGVSVFQVVRLIAVALVAEALSNESFVNWGCCWTVIASQSEFVAQLSLLSLLVFGESHWSLPKLEES